MSLGFRRRRGIQFGRVFLPYTEDDSQAKLSHSSSTATVATAETSSSSSGKSKSTSSNSRSQSQIASIREDYESDEQSETNSCPEVDTFVSSLTGLSSNRDIGMMSKDEIIGLLYNEAIRFKEKSEELETKLDKTLQERDQAQVRMMLANEKLSRLRTDTKIRMKRLTDEGQMMQESLDEAVAINQELHKSLQDQLNEKQVLIFRLDAQEGTITFLRRKIAELSAMLNNRSPNTAAASTTTVSDPKTFSVHSPPQRSVHNSSSSSGALSGTLSSPTDASGFASDMRLKMEQRRSKRNGLISRMNCVGSGFSGDDRTGCSSSESSSSSTDSSLKSTGLDADEDEKPKQDTPNPSVEADDGSSQTENMRRQFSRHKSIQNALSFFANEDRGISLEGRMNGGGDDVISVISALSEVKDCDSSEKRGIVGIPERSTNLNSRGPRAA